MARMRYVLCLTAAPLLMGGIGGIWWMAPAEDFDAWRRGTPPATWAHRADRLREAQRAAPGQASHWRYVPLVQVASDLKLAILVGEDTSFFGHGPLDPEAMWEAVAQWLRGRRQLRGASTISQQLAKNLFLSNERSWWRKVDELRLAFWLEREFSKRRIFELYVNVIELGPGIYGVDAAAQYYFGRSAAALDAEQAASLAASIPGPLISNAKTQTRAWDRRRQAIVARMQHLDILRRWVD